MTSESYGRAYQDGLNQTVRFLLSRGVGRENVADIAQTAWLKGWERLSQLRDDSVILSWVNTIALNDFRRSVRYDRFTEFVREPAYDDSLNWIALDVSRILQSCRAKDRFLLEAQMEGNTVKDLARQTGASQAAIRVRLLRARRAARKAVQRVASAPRPLQRTQRGARSMAPVNAHARLRCARH